MAAPVTDMSRVSVPVTDPGQSLIPSSSPSTATYQATANNTYQTQQVSSNTLTVWFTGSSGAAKRSAHSERCYQLGLWCAKAAPFAVLTVFGGACSLLIQNFEKELGLTDVEGEIIGNSVAAACILLGIILTYCACRPSTGGNSAQRGEGA